MRGTLTILEIAGHVGLLLWGTHMVTTGVQRGFGAELRRRLGRNLSQRWRAFLAGLAVTALLQSSTAAALMATSFTITGLISLGTGLAVMLGANVGTTLIAQLLSFDVASIAPLLILAGVFAFRWSDDDRIIKNLGRIAIGLGLMLMALSGLARGLAPVEQSPVLETLLAMLGGEPLLAVAVAALLTSACHSSLAVILFVVSLVSTHVVAPTPALALVLGANLGGTLGPLFEAGSPSARRLPFGNMVIRASGCAASLPFLPFCADLLARIDPVPARVVVNFHTAFNLALAALFILPTEPIARLLTRLLPDPPEPADPGEPIHLEPAALDAASVALANASRETLRMADMVEAMLRSALEVFRQDDRQRADEISRLDRAADRLGGAIRRYLADLGNKQTLDDEDEGVRAQEILSAVINLEHVGDIIANGLMEFAVKKIKGGRAFSAAELGAISAIHRELFESLQLGLAVFLHGDVRAAGRLLARKAPLRRMEAEATALHVRLLRDACADCRSTGDVTATVAEEGGLFLRVVRDLRRIHSHIAALAYPALDGPRRGDGRALDAQHAGAERG